MIVLWSQSVLGGPTRCPLMQNFLKYYPDDPKAQTECIACPECPPGLGLVPQCGSKITNYTTIKCEPCQLNKTFSDNHGFESCRSCHNCGLKNVIQQYTPSQNRKCEIVGMIIASILVLIFVLYVIKRIISCRNGLTPYSEGKRKSYLATLLLTFMRIVS